MKKLLLLASLSIFGLGSMSAKSFVSQKEKSNLKLPPTCYNIVYDSHGNQIGLVTVKCPDVIVVK